MMAKKKKNEKKKEKKKKGKHDKNDLQNTTKTIDGETRKTQHRAELREDCQFLFH